MVLTNTRYSLMELMICAAASQLEDNQTAVIGTGAPLAAAMLAQKTTAPNLVILFEAGAMAPILERLPISVSGSETQTHALVHGSMDEVMEACQRGLVDYTFLGGAQIDQYGNINTTVIGDYRKPTRRLPGSGGANDVASHSKRILIITRHEKRRFPAHCDYITSPGYLFGPEGRQKAGLKVTTPRITVVTDLAVMEITHETGTMQIVKLMPNVGLATVLDNLQFAPAVSPHLIEVELPTAEQIRILREEVDPAQAYLKRDGAVAE
jgi:glutaconate CoA-transferase subunit B